MESRSAHGLKKAAKAILLVLSSLMLLPAAGAPAPDASASKEGARGTWTSNASRQDRARVEFASLPLAAQAAISSTLGRDDLSYHASRSAGGFRAENRRHALAVAFTRRGVDVRAGESRLGLSLEAWGYGEALGSLAPAAPRAQANRISYRRGTLTEWYVNGPLGLEQGFTLAAPPAARNGGALTLALALTGDLRASLTPRRDEVTLAREAGVPALRYRGLEASDARGRELPAWLELRGRSLFLRVDDAGALYPLAIDPLVQQAQLTASDGAAGDRFGVSVAIAGDTVVVGAERGDGATVNQGSAYVFVKPAGGWAGPLTEQAKLTASDGGRFDRFGESVAIAGDTVVVGALSDDSAYIFVKPAGGWAGALTEQAKLTASDGTASDLFGFSVAIAGNTVVVGAREGDVGANFNQGSAYVFVKPAGGWAGALTEQAKLTASDGAAFDDFGVSVAIAGNTVVVGAFSDDVGANFNQGSAYVFVKPAGDWAGALTEQAKLTASDGAMSDLFGFSVAIAGNTVVVGALPDDLKGSAYVFVKPAEGWAGALTEQAKLTASDRAATDLFGVSVAIAGNTVVVGARGDDVGASLGQGSAYVFVKPAGGWAGALTEQAKLTASDGAATDLFGVSVAIAGNTVVVGADGDDVGANFAQGSAYLFGPGCPPNDDDDGNGEDDDDECPDGDSDEHGTDDKGDEDD